MKWPTIVGSVMLAACSEMPRSQLDLSVTEKPDMAQSPSLDLSGTVPSADLKIAPPTLTNVSPSSLTTAGGPITLTGTNFSVKTEFFINNLPVNFSLSNSTTAVLMAPAMPGQVGPVQITVRNADGQSVTNSNTTGSLTALSFAASKVRFTQSNVYLVTGAVSPKPLVIGDVNADGKPDLVVGLTTTYDILLGDGRGDFTRSVLPTGVQNSNFATVANQAPLQIVLADLNNDTYPDLIMGTTSATVHYYLNGGATNPGIFTAVTKSNAGTLSVASVAVADFNKDTFPDIVFTNTSANTATTGTIGLLVGGQTGFTPANLFPVAATTIAVTNSPTRLVAADINKDGFQDVVFVGQVAGTYTLNVLIGTGAGTTATTVFTFPTPGGYGTNNTVTTTQATQFPQWVEVADLNHDGNLDAVVTDSNTATLRVFLGNGTSTNTFQAPVTYSVNNNPFQVSIGDLNGDGFPDLVVANSNNLINALTVLLGKGDGTFPTRLDIPSSNSPYSVQITDLNNDGLQDLVVVNQLTSTNVAPGNVTTFLNSSQ